MSGNVLFTAARLGHVRTIRSLVRRGYDVNEPDEDGYYALIEAVYYGQTASVQVLLESKADVNLSDPEGTTALKCAAEKGEVESARLLLEAGADIGYLGGGDGGSAMHRAAVNGHVAIIELLVSHNADVNITNIDDETPLDLVYFFSTHYEINTFWKVVETLQHHGAEAYLRTPSGKWKQK